MFLIFKFCSKYFNVNNLTKYEYKHAIDDNVYIRTKLQTH